jgi:DNA-binding winged helix-turn-helix (wHTH) protein/Tol biopolymer transport system component
MVVNCHAIGRAAMSSSSTPVRVIRFGIFEANLRSGELRKSGIRIKLHDQPFQILTMLLERPGELVTREEIRNRLWPGDTFVDFDHSLNNAVNRLREALGDSADSPRFIETLPRRGYRFVGQTDGTGFVEIGESPSAQTEVKRTEPIHAIRSRAYHWFIGIGLVIAAVAGIVAYQLYRAPFPPSSRLFLLPPEGTTFNLIGDEGGSVAVSSDGTRIAFVALSTRGNTEVWVRPLGSLTSTAVDGTDGATFPFWSPDGRFLGFFAGGKLKKVSLDGSNSPVVLCDAPFGRGGSWSSRGVIIFAPNSHSAIYAVPDRGGDPTPVTVLDASTQTTHRWPKFLPDGKHFIYLAANHFNETTHDAVYLGSLDRREANKLIVPTDADATYASGYLFFLRKDVFMAQRFSAETAELRGEPHATLEKVLYDPTIWKAVFDASSKGLMAYQLGDRVRGTQFRWFDRAGRQVGVLGEPIFQWEPSISRDGKRLVVGIAGGGYSNLWVYDLVRGGRMQITFSKYDSGTPVWFRRSSRILFTSKRQHYSIYEVDSRGAEPERLVLDIGSDIWPLDISPDERFLLFGRGLTIGKAKSEIWVYAMSGGGRHFRLLAGDAREGQAQFSPDGRWVAYTSNESGRDEVYVVPFSSSIVSRETRSAALLGKWKISDGGGHAPRWRRNGAELFYLASDNTVMAVPVSTHGSKFEFQSARPLFRANPGFYSVSYDVSPNGNKFVVNTAPEERTAPITVVENWLSDLTTVR